MAIATAALTLAAASSTGPSAAGVGGPASPLVPRAERVAGRTYAQWEVAWWRWDAAHNHLYASSTPAPTADVACDEQGQPRTVWLLGDTAPLASRLTVRCVVPAARHIFVGKPNVDCSTLEAPP